MTKNTNELLNKLIEANNKYREGNPIMSDYEFDKLEAELKSIDPDNQWFKKGVNDETPKEREFKLPYPMMSLNKVKRIEDVISWMDNFPNCSFVITPKFDGLSVGMSKSMSWTRGDGMIGQLCTKHINCTSNKPYINEDEIIRGEIIIENSNWTLFKKEHEEAKSQRNSATGLINGDFDLDKQCDYQLLTVMPYCSQNVKGNKDKELERIGADYQYAIVSKDKVNEEYLNNLFFDWSSHYPMDGLVIDVNEEEYRNGTEANGNPSFTIAYKHPTFSETAVSTISKIERNVNRNGVVTPIIHIEPSVVLSGAEISKVNGINLSYVKEWKMYEGQQVTIVRSGEVIPKIIAVGGIEIPFKEHYSSNAEYKKEYDKQLEKRKKASSTVFNKDINFYHCPSCGEPLTKIGAEYVCLCDSCKGKTIQKIVKFFEICGIDGFSEAKLKPLYEYYSSIIGGVYKDVLDYFNFTYENITSSWVYTDKKRNELSGWGEKTVRKFIEELDKIKNKGVCMARLFHALGYFDELGEKTIQKILDTVEPQFLLVKDKLLEVEGIQEITANMFIKGYLEYLDNKDRIDSIFDLSYVKTPINDVQGNLSGKVICATGFRDKVLFKQIQDNGGTVLDSLTKVVNCLIVKDLSSTSSKVTKAKKMGIEIIDRDTFVDTYMNDTFGKV